MKLKEVPQSTAYVVFHDGYDNGAMDIWPCDNTTVADLIASQRQLKLDESGLDGGMWKSYIKLPHKRVHKYHSNPLTLTNPQRERI